MDFKEYSKISREKSAALPSTSQSQRYPSFGGSIFTQSATSLTREVIKWSFPRAQRFKESLRDTIDVPLLNLGSTLSKTSTSLGFGKRYTFRPVETPGPGIAHREMPLFKTRNLSSSQSTNNLQNLNFCTRESWDTHKEIPGPGSYEIKRSLLSENKGVQLKSRLNPLNSIKENPGPNYYSPKANTVEKNRFSAIVFGTSKRSDFTKIATARNPGPGSYEILSNFERKAKEFRIRDEQKKSKAKNESRIL
ncbi:hypothetical protein SteCoe_17008 [Stentor coeruleus]|uniref:Uncharacterized protein n=1 Tax=Stentor coeruleus TaxID=5963 RepID=A0A1R2C017_9CILI|nr:hypothetical protein SteCoe_17008 [Stentor coeruleus]